MQNMDYFCEQPYGRSINESKEFPHEMCTRKLTCQKELGREENETDVQRLCRTEQFKLPNED